MKAILYMHGGSENHGCEALVRTTADIIGNLFDEGVEVFSNAPQEDERYITDTKISFVDSYHKPKKKSFEYLQMAVRSKLFHDRLAYVGVRYKNLIKSFNASTVAFSIGGDNYCYDGKPALLGRLNKLAKKAGSKTVLFGASIEPELLKDKEIVEDLKGYALITVRESITFDALTNAGIDKNTKLFPDSAFTLPCKAPPSVPEGFFNGNTIGINISPLAINCGAEPSLVFENYIALIDNILRTSDMKIALIPHVVWEDVDDRKPLGEIYEHFKDTGRIVTVDDHNCMELKGYIAGCRMFIGARTHATIAAYSSCVPTLVVGYSVKSKGIAKDIFGTYDNYVIPVQELRNKEDLTKAFNWIKLNETGIKNHLKEFMPAYISKAGNAGEAVQKLLEGTS